MKLRAALPLLLALLAAGCTVLQPSPPRGPTTEDPAGSEPAPPREPTVETAPDAAEGHTVSAVPGPAPLDPAPSVSGPVTSTGGDARIGAGREAGTPPPRIAPIVEVPAPATPGPGPDETALPRLCSEIGGLLGSVSVDTCMASRLVDGGGRSHDGRILAWTEFPGTGPDAPRILVVGGIHGDEYSSISMVFRWIERLAEEHRGARSWRLVPAANPDGLLRARPATRANARGVDLNRNFATRGWADEAPRYWTERTGNDPRRRPGPEAASEPETRWLQDLITDYQPRVIVSLHAPHALLDFDAAVDAPPAPERLGFLQLRPLGTYPGSLGRYGSTELGVSVLTLELPWAGIMPSMEDQEALWEDLAAWLAEHLPADDEGTTITAR